MIYSQLLKREHMVVRRRRRRVPPSRHGFSITYMVLFIDRRKSRIHGMTGKWVKLIKYIKKALLQINVFGLIFQKVILQQLI